MLDLDQNTDKLLKDFSASGIGISVEGNNLKIESVRPLTNNQRNWGWTRGISWKLRLEKFYEKLRKNKMFRKFDYEIDDMFEKISIQINKEPTIFLKCKIK